MRCAMTVMNSFMNNSEEPVPVAMLSEV